MVHRKWRRPLTSMAWFQAMPSWLRKNTNLCSKSWLLSQMCLGLETMIGWWVFVMFFFWWTCHFWCGDVQQLPWFQGLLRGRWGKQTYIWTKALPWLTFTWSRLELLVYVCLAEAPCKSVDFAILLDIHSIRNMCNTAKVVGRVFQPRPKDYGTKGFFQNGRWLLWSHRLDSLFCSQN